MTASPVERRRSGLAFTLAVLGLLASLAAVVPGWLEQLLTRVTLAREALPPSPRLLVASRIGAMVVAVGLMIAARRAWRASWQAPRMREAIRRDLNELSGGSRAVMFTLAVLVLGGALFRSAFLTQPLGYDESITYVYFASRGWLDVVADYAIPNNHIFHSLLLHLVDRVAGPVPMLLRMPAFIAGVLVVPLGGYLAFRITRERGAAILATALLAVAPVMVEFAAQARGYSLLALLFVIALLIATFIDAHESRWGWVALAGVSALGLWTVPTYALGSAAPFAWLLLAGGSSRWRARLRNGLVTGVGAIVLVALLYLPAVVSSGWDSLLANQYVAPLSMGAWLDQLAGRATLTLQCWSGGVPTFIAAAVIVVAVAGVAFDPVRRSVGRLVVALIIAMVPVVVLMRVAPMPRMVHFLFPAAMVIVSAGLDAVLRRVARRRTALLPHTVGLLLAAGWILVRLDIGDAGWDRSSAASRPAQWGVYGTSCCTEGFFVDGPAIAERFAKELAQGTLLVAHVYSGVVESTQFTLMRHGVSPVAARPVRYGNGLDQVADAPELLVVIKRDRPAGDEPRDVLDLLRADQASYDAVYLPPERVATLMVSDVYRVRRRVAHDGPPVPLPVIEYPQ